ncbi:MAG: dihydrolipoyl dehydrogenase [Myxococcales bacterium]|nr:dihydrolipoyl dehydrogenase [Myxococcota bacterium]MDW8282775.1 dihydrolipoyl dehydrogenase [Myxococcales bacterium]
MAEASYDVAVVGSGPGGYVAAIRAAQLGLRVAVVEQGELGGVCTNWGCIPTKALLHSAEVYAALKDGGALGLVADGLRVDFARVIARSRQVAETQRKGIGILFKKNGIVHLPGRGRLRPAAGGGGVQLLCNGQPVPARHVVLATGARPRRLPGIEPDGQHILTYVEAMSLPAQPATLLVVGAGAIGVEFAYFYNALGTRVTLIEALPRILPLEDEEISQQVERSLRRQGIHLFTGARVTGVQIDPQGVVAGFLDRSGQPQTARGERLLLAVGVEGNVEDLGLQDCGVQVERGFVQVNEWYQALGPGGAVVPGLYAIGDVIGGPLLAHKASAEGIACVERIAGVPERDIHRVDRSAIPAATFCRPEVASVGLTEAQARQAGREVKIGRFPFRVSGKGQAAGETEGLVKVVLCARTGEVLGAHIVGGSASDMIATMTLARAAELTATEISHTIFAHPTFAEVLKGAVEAARGEAIDL